MRTYIPCLLPIAALFASCGDDGSEADAYGNFEAVETLVSAKGAGELIDFRVEEGMRLRTGEPVGTIDTTLLSLQAEQVAANREAIASHTEPHSPSGSAGRARRGPATGGGPDWWNWSRGRPQPRSNWTIYAGKSPSRRNRSQRWKRQNPGIVSQVRAMNAQEAMIRKQIADMRIVNPTSGTVVSKLAEPHELAAPGRALYRIAALDTLELRAYISGTQLASLEQGSSVEVGIDGSNGGLIRLPVASVGSAAERSSHQKRSKHAKSAWIWSTRSRCAWRTVKAS